MPEQISHRSKPRPTASCLPCRARKVKVCLSLFPVPSPFPYLLYQTYKYHYLLSNLIPSPPQRETESAHLPFKTPGLSVYQSSFNLLVHACPCSFIKQHRIPKTVFQLHQREPLSQRKSHFISLTLTTPVQPPHPLRHMRGTQHPARMQVRRSGYRSSSHCSSRADRGAPKPGEPIARSAGHGAGARDLGD